MYQNKWLNKKIYQILSRNIEGKFNEHLESKITKCNKIIGLMKELSQFHSRKSLLTFYKSFVRPNLDYTDIITTNHQISLSKKIEIVQ